MMTMTEPVAVAPPAPDADRLHRPDPQDIPFFAAISDYPCVSIVLATRPGARMEPVDRAHLEALIAVAHRRLQEEGLADADTVAEALRDRAQVVSAGPTDQGLVIYARRGMVEHRHLPIAVADRVVVDPTFATRDLVRAVQANPDYLLLVLDADSAHLYGSRVGALAAIEDDQFPIRRTTENERKDTGARPGRRRGSRPGRTDQRQREQTRTFLRRVDTLLAARLARKPQPVIVMAGDRILSDFLSVTQMSDRIIGLARGSGSKLGLRRLERAVRPLLSDHIADLEAAAHDTLEARMPGREVVTGLPACWHAALSERPELLLVEQSYAMPARLSADGSLLAVTGPDERELPEVIDDAVDELIELVISKRGQVRFVPDGSLPHDDRIALSVVLPRRRR